MGKGRGCATGKEGDDELVGEAFPWSGYAGWTGALPPGEGGDEMEDERKDERKEERRDERRGGEMRGEERGEMRGERRGGETIW